MDDSHPFSLLCQLAGETDDVRKLENLFCQIRDVNETDIYKRKPLWYAAKTNTCLEILISFLNAKAVVDYKIVENAVINNPNDEVAIYLYNQIKPLNKNELDKLFLLATASKLSLYLAKYFLEEGASLEATLEMDIYPNINSIEDDILDEDFLWEDDYGVAQNAIVIAIYENQNSLEIVKGLIEIGVDVNRVDAEGFTPLFHALDNNELVKVLIEGGADFNKVDDDGKTALMHACLSENNDVALTLIKYGCDVNKLSLEGENALHYALSGHISDNYAVIKALIEAGCDVNQRDSDLLLPLDIARFNFCSQKIINLLIENGAKMGSDFY